MLLVSVVLATLVCVATSGSTQWEGFHDIVVDCWAGIEFDEWLSNSPPADSDYKLIQSQGFIRHGARTVCSHRLCWNTPNYPMNCSQSITIQPSNYGLDLPTNFGFQLKRRNGSEVFPGNCMVGQLTALGYQMEYKHGVGLRERYVDAYGLLPDSFQSGEDIDQIILLRADDSPRVQQSAMGLFTGLYDVASQQSSYQISLHTQDSTYENIYPNSNVCPGWGTNEADSKTTSAWKEHYDNVSVPILAELNTFMASGDEDDTGFAFDCATAYACAGNPIPDAYTQDLYDRVQTDALWYRKFYNTYPNWANGTRYRSGPILRITNNRFINTVNALKQRTNQSESAADDFVKFYVYAGHDTGPIMPLLGAFQYDFRKWCPYAALITMELWQKGSDFYVAVSYDGKVIPLPAPCDSADNEYQLCSWDAFQRYLEPVIPTIEECPFLEALE